MNNFSSDGMAFGPTSNNGTMSNETAISTANIYSTQLSRQNPKTLSGFGDFNPSIWIWIIFLFFIFSTAIFYIYKLPQKNN